MGANLIHVEERNRILTLLPRTVGRFTRYSLKVNKLRYHCEGYAECYLKGGEVTVAYNPEDVTSVWLLDNGTYIEFTLIESRFQGKNLTEVQEIQVHQKAITKNAEHDDLQAQIDLAQHIEAVVYNVKNSSDVNLKGIRSTRKREQNKLITHLFFNGPLDCISSFTGWCRPIWWCFRGQLR